MSESDHFKPHFRAIRSGGKRRGFSLERVFWTALEELTKADGVSVADYIERLDADRTGASGLSSQLRASIMQRILERYEGLQDRTGLHTSRAIVSACPVPAFIISVDKKILFQNSAFLMYLQTRFIGLDTAAALADVRLSLETPLVDVIEQMKTESGRSQQVGFTIGYGERRLRGRLSMAPVPGMVKPPAAIAFVSGSV
ncbi:hypothetical protein LL06_11145 [Hoeflea sp. BAL378]|uniref:ribbon-helix-helix domain-containing protein n=1 Tax=Hoeflea sp. BAL378 TaxID=1547437 RepID=UPI000513897B|nr:ribbon-helix-helix domain-containing protein [Hoeflea sp. BAL378]KGF69504.1 hypothetical protein LL06_11145 [Hoeflea sp. BAL378]